MVTYREILEEEEKKKKGGDGYAPAVPASSTKAPPAKQDRAYWDKYYADQKTDSPLKFSQSTQRSTSPGRIVGRDSLDFSKEVDKPYRSSLQRRAEAVPKKKFEPFKWISGVGRAYHTLPSSHPTGPDINIIDRIKKDYGNEWSKMTESKRITTLGQIYDSQNPGARNTPDGRVARTKWMNTQLRNTIDDWENETIVNNKQLYKYEQYAQDAKQDLSKMQTFPDLSGSQEWNSLTPAQQKTVIGDFYARHNKKLGKVDIEDRENFVQAGIIASAGDNPWVGAEEGFDKFASDPKDTLYDEHGITRQLDRYKKMANSSSWWATLDDNKKRFVLERDFDKSFADELKKQGKSPDGIKAARDRFVDEQINIKGEIDLLGGEVVLGKHAVRSVAGIGSTWARTLGGHNQSLSGPMSRAIEWGDRAAGWSETEQEELAKKYGGKRLIPGIEISEIPGLTRSLAQSVAISAPAQLAGVGGAVLGGYAGAASSVTEGGTTAPAKSALGATLGRMAAAGAVSYGLAKATTEYDVMKAALEKERMLVVADRRKQKAMAAINPNDPAEIKAAKLASLLMQSSAKDISPDEWTKDDEAKVREKYASVVSEYGHSEALPEAISEMAFSAIPGGNQISKAVLGKSIFKAGEKEAGKQLTKLLGKETLEKIAANRALKFGGKAISKTIPFTGEALTELPSEAVTQIWQENIGYNPLLKGTKFESKGTGPKDYTVKNLLGATKEVATSVLFTSGGMGAVHMGMSKAGGKIQNYRMTLDGPGGEKVANKSIDGFMRDVMGGQIAEKDIIRTVALAKGFKGEHGKRMGDTMLDISLDYMETKGKDAPLLDTEKGGQIRLADVRALNEHLEQESQKNPDDKLMASQAERTKAIYQRGLESQLNNILPDIQRGKAKPVTVNAYNQVVAEIERITGEKYDTQSQERMDGAVGPGQELGGVPDVGTGGAEITGSAVPSAQEQAQGTGEQVAAELTAGPGVAEQGLSADEGVGATPAVTETAPKPSQPKGLAAKRQARVDAMLAEKGKNATVDDYIAALYPSGSVGIEINRESLQKQLNKLKKSKKATGVAPAKGILGAEQGKSIIEPGADATPSKGKFVRGKTTSAFGPSNEKIDAEFQLREAGELSTSHDDSGSVNQNYPAELQPRERGRAANMLQIESISQNINPELLGESPNIQNGAPIIGPDGIAESGNGRIMALRRAYQTEQGQKYKQWLLANAKKFGLDPNSIAKMKNPVLVRTRLTNVNRQEFTRQANRPDIIDMAPSEQAASDASRMSDNLMAMLNPDESGNMAAASNRDFIKGFVSMIGPQEAAGLVTAKGMPTKKLMDRMTAAVFMKVYKNKNLLELMAEETDNNIKSILNGMIKAAPTFSKVPADSRSNITGEIVDAALFVRDARNEGLAIPDALAQMELLDPRSKVMESIARAFSDYQKAPSKIGNFLKALGDVASGNEQVLSEGPMFPGMEGEVKTYDPLEMVKEARDSVETGKVTKFAKGDKPKEPKPPSLENKQQRMTGDRIGSFLRDFFGKNKSAEPIDTDDLARMRLTDRVNNILPDSPMGQIISKFGARIVESVVPVGNQSPAIYTAKAADPVTGEMMFLAQSDAGQDFINNFAIVARATNYVRNWTKGYRLLPVVTYTGRGSDARFKNGNKPILNRKSGIENKRGAGDYKSQRASSAAVYADKDGATSPHMHPDFVKVRALFDLSTPINPSNPNDARRTEKLVSDYIQFAKDYGIMINGAQLRSEVSGAEKLLHVYEALGTATQEANGSSLLEINEETIDIDTFINDMLRETRNVDALVETAVEDGETYIQEMVVFSPENVMSVFDKKILQELNLSEGSKYLKGGGKEYGRNIGSDEKGQPDRKVGHPAGGEVRGHQPGNIEEYEVGRGDKLPSGEVPVPGGAGVGNLRDNEATGPVPGLGTESSLGGVGVGTRGERVVRETGEETGGAVEGGGVRPGTERTEPGRTAETARLNSRLSAITSKWAKRWQGSVVALSNASEIPNETLRAEVEAENAKGQGLVEGVYDEATRTAYVFSDALNLRKGETQEQAAIRVSFAEIMRHAGVREAFAGDTKALDNWLNDLWSAKLLNKKNSDVVNEIVRLWGTDKNGKIKPEWDPNTREGRRNIAEEWFAHYYDEGRHGGGWVRRFSAIVRDFMRRNFPGLNLKLSDSEILDMARKSREAITEGKVGTALPTTEQFLAVGETATAQFAKGKPTFQGGPVQENLFEAVGSTQKGLFKDEELARKPEKVAPVKAEATPAVALPGQKGLPGMEETAVPAKEMPAKGPETAQEAPKEEKKGGGPRQGTLFSKVDPGVPHAPDDVAQQVLPAKVAERDAASKGLPIPKDWEDVKRKAKLLNQQVWRHFQFLNPDKYGDVINWLRVLEHQADFSKVDAQNKLQEIVGELSKGDYETLRLVLINEDIMRDLDDGVINPERMDELPFGYKSRQEVENTLAKLAAIKDKTPAVKEAYDKHKKLFGNLAQDMLKHDLITKEAATKDRYFHHQVLFYRQMEIDRGFRTGGKVADVRVHTEGYQKGRKPSKAYEYNTDYLQSYYEVLSGALRQIETQKTINKIKAKYDIKQKLMDEADAYNIAQKALIPASFSGKGKIIKGDMVRPVDRFNIGTVVDMDPSTGEVEVHFYNKKTKESADKVFDISDLTVPAMDKFKSWKDMVPKDHLLWYDKPEGIRYQTYSIADKYVQQFMDGMALEPQMFNQVMALDPGDVMVLPEGIAMTMNNLKITRSESDSMVAEAVQALQSRWKEYILLNPLRFIKYNLNNMSGDLDIVLAYKPGILRHAPQAMRLLFIDRAKMTQEEREWMDLASKQAVIGSGQVIQDIGKEIPRLKQWAQYYKAPERSLPGKVAMSPIAMANWWFDKASRASAYRENVLRLAAFKYFQEHSNERLYGASDMDIVDAVTDKDERAALLARELLGDYGNLTVLGQYTRNNLVPFYSWVEINAPRYVRMMKNAAYEQNGKSGLVRMGAIATKNVAKRLVMMNLMFGLVNAINHIFHPDEEEELGLEGMKQMHIIIGRDKYGEVIPIRAQGAFSDALSWFGGENLVADIKNLYGGEMSGREFATEAAISPINKLIGGLAPQYKVPAELLFKRSLFPDAFRARAIRDPLEHAARTVTLDWLVRWAKGRPVKGSDLLGHQVPGRLGELIDQLLFYKTDPGLYAYYDTMSLVRRFRKNKDHADGNTVDPGDTSNALCYFKQAIKYNDEKAMRKYMDEILYYKNGNKEKALESIQKSIESADPLGGLKTSEGELTEFWDTLTAREQERVRMGLAWYENTYITEDEDKYRRYNREAAQEDKSSRAYKVHLKYNAEVTGINKNIDIIESNDMEYRQTNGNVWKEKKGPIEDEQEELAALGIETKVVPVSRRDGKGTAGYALQRTTPAFSEEEKRARREPYERERAEAKRNFVDGYGRKFEGETLEWGQNDSKKTAYKNKRAAEARMQIMMVNEEKYKGMNFEVVKVKKEDGYSRDGYMIREIP